MADAVVDAHTQEQGRLLRAFHFGQDRPKDEWSSTGPRSLSPFVPCASARIAAVFSAARLTHEDVLWDLGCGDGRVLVNGHARRHDRVEREEPKEAGLPA